MIADRARLVSRFIGSALAVVLLLTIVNDSMRYVLAWSQVYLAVRDMNAALAPVVKAQPGESAPASREAVAAAGRFGVGVDTYDQELEQSSTSRTVHISVALSNPVEQTIYGAPLQASEWKWPVRYWWHADAAPAIHYEWNSRVVLQSDVQ